MYEPGLNEDIYRKGWNDLEEVGEKKREAAQEYMKQNIIVTYYFNNLH